MKAISLLQPWASLIAIGAKQWESRSWQTKYRGQVALHASLKRPDYRILATHPFKSALAAGMPCRECQGRDKRCLICDGLGFEAPPCGAILAVADVTEIIDTGEWLRRHCHHGQLSGPHAREYTFGDYSPKRFAWKMENIRRLPEPVECKGALMLWRVPSSAEESILKQFR